MTGLRRMVESEATPVERWLLDSAQDDVPPTGGAHRLLVGLGVGASAASIAGSASLAEAATHTAVATGTTATAGTLGVAEAAATGTLAAAAGGATAAAGGATATAGSVTAKVFAVAGAKWLGAGVVAGAIATGAIRTAVTVTPNESTTISVHSSSLSATESGEHRTRRVATGLPSVLPTQADSTQPKKQGRGAAATARADAEDTGGLGVRSVPSESASDAPAEGPASIAAEVAVVDQARSSLRSGDVHGAMTALAAHDREYGGGALNLEAGRLQCEALLAAGKRSAAAACARQYVATYPKSPHAASMRALVARVDGPTPSKPAPSTASFEAQAVVPVSAPPPSARSTGPVPPSVDPGTPSAAAFPDD